LLAQELLGGGQVSGASGSVRGPGGGRNVGWVRGGIVIHIVHRTLRRVMDRAKLNGTVPHIELDFATFKSA
jgi:hypothetical protein